MKKKVLAMLLAVVMAVGLLPVAAFADDEPAADANGFVINENGILLGYVGDGGDVEIPDSVTFIDVGALADCTSLTSVTIPASVNGIGKSAFAGCTALTAIKVDEGNLAYVSEDGVLFSANKATLHTYPAGKSGTSCTIPASVTLILSGAFDGCTSLTDIYYGGTQEQWNDVSIGDNNDVLLMDGVTVHFAEDEEPTEPEEPAEDEEPTEPTEPTEPEEPTEPAEPETPELPTKFSDVPAGIWYADTVSAAVERGLIKGVGGGKFDPTGILTRASALIILGRLAEADVNGGTPWYQKAMDWAAAEGISENEDPDGDITREELAVMLWRFTDDPKAADPSVLDKYPDASSISSEALEAMAWAVENGIIKGSDGKWNPQGTADRSQAITMIMRYCDKFDK